MSCIVAQCDRARQIGKKVPLRPVTGLGHQEAKSFLRGAQTFKTMSNTFFHGSEKFCPTPL